MTEIKVPWHVICEPHEGNTTGEEKTNEGGLIIYLTDDVIRCEFQAVAFERRHVAGSYKMVPFKKQLRAQMEAAQAACDAMNEANAEADRLRQQAFKAAQSNGQLTRALDEATRAIDVLASLRETLRSNDAAARTAESRAQQLEREARDREATPV